MIAVALLATAVFAEKMRRQRAISRERAAYYAEQEREARRFVQTCKMDLAAFQARLKDVSETLRDCNDPHLRPFFISQVKEKENWVADCEASVREAEGELDRLARLRERWEQTAIRPWLSPPPDLDPGGTDS